MTFLVQHEEIQTASGTEQHVLFAIEHERLWRRAEAADLGIPQALAGRGVPGLDVLPVAQEQNPAGLLRRTGWATTAQTQEAKQ